MAFLKYVFWQLFVKSNNLYRRCLTERVTSQGEIPKKYRTICHNWSNKFHLFLLGLADAATWLGGLLDVELRPPLLGYLVPAPLHVLLLEVVVRLVVQLLLVHQRTRAVLPEHDAEDYDQEEEDHDADEAVDQELVELLLLQVREVRPLYNCLGLHPLRLVLHYLFLFFFFAQEFLIRVYV